MLVIAIVYLESFLLSVTPNVREQLAPGSLYSELTGIVVESSTGAPVGFANIILAGTTKGAMSLDNGQFLIKEIEPGDYQVKIMMRGYVTESRFVYIPPGKSVVLNSRLTKKPSWPPPLRIDVFNPLRRPRYVARPDSIDANWQEKEHELWSLEVAYWRHIRDGDFMGWVDLFHPRFKVYDDGLLPRPDLYSVIDATGNFLQRKKGGNFTFELTEPQVMIMENTAVIHYRCAWTVTMPDGSVLQSNKIHTREWRRINKQWWLYRASRSDTK